VNEEIQDKARKLTIKEEVLKNISKERRIDEQVI